ncbi:AraC family transcriptional regulator [Halopseudomonas aestusnigri]|uniref:AraC-type DNA-binding protein n=1 Tax=Halopseudomonas aestusnigri TaxID=857252 RepID=A0AAQ1JR78_9GAMM|nr:AraC family transcriptional regulator [Halopseudomonas aestusnigri]OWL85407.1 hypothetical protein B7O88_14905 [Halopseudomonas aestusnigri]SEG64778.1 AraC-type DNA-binding protein [Halopseudomonas aestusnigri]
MNWREVRDATNVRHLLNTARGLGCSVEACLQGSGLDEGVLSAGARIQRWQELAVIRNLVALAPEPGLGLLVGSRYQLTSLGLLGYTMLACRNLHEALLVSTQFRELTLSICPVQLQPFDGGVRMSLDHKVLPPDAQDMVAERGLAVWKRIFGELLQRPFVPFRVELALSRPATAECYETYFECPVVMGAASNAVLIADADLTSALPLANELTRNACAALCRQLCDGLEDVVSPFARQVLQVLISHSGEPPAAVEVAAALGISERSLHRRLAAEGQPFRQLDERVRARLAERLLGDSDLGLDAIAAQLGYSEAASFSRAFKRWTGVSPSHWRAAQRAAALGLEPSSPAVVPSRQY